MTPCSVVDSWTLRLLLLVRREHVDDAVDRLRRVLGVQGREHEVAGLGRGDRGGDRLEVTHLADEDHVGVLTQDVLQGRREAVRVGPDLALVHDAALVLVQELDRVLDGHDVTGALAVHDVDHGRQGGRLARPGRSRDDHEPAREPRQIGGDRRQTEVLEVLDLERDHPEDRADRVALHVDVDTEPSPSGQGVRHVELELLLEALAHLLGQDRVDHALQRTGRERGVLTQALELAVYAHRRRRARGQVQVRSVRLQELPEQLWDRHLEIVFRRSYRAHVTSPPLQPLPVTSGPSEPSPDHRPGASSSPAVRRQP